MEILQEETDSKGRFYILIDQQPKAEMTYVWAGPDQIIIDHTAVDDSLRGTGVGKQMLLKAVEFARAKGIRIVPLCPFARSVFDKTKFIRDVL
ncbi:GNAT family N-acetyltransferase [Reichenbachiella agarivorans]|uniref:GNAT family N-acetyltransferase n=1 Tax=Reichenbachiella agarivorans TaxID=2979464 RepID=A0ABY6CK44_9BACT|nr:GNAT family N-acetyltransferase [Reichenbachiella agarivorans]UXP30891.1 GNAT family N-acetyltransferase [Reichenbachiella agarivorans]